MSEPGLRITDLLRGEHGTLHARLDRVEAVLLEDTTTAAVRCRARDLLASLRTHARIEEELLMEPLAAAGADGAGRRDEIEEEHAEIEALLERTVRDEDPARAVHLLRRSIALARGHFSREEHLEFPLAETRIDEAELRSLGRRWAARRGVYAPNGDSDDAAAPGAG